MGDLIEFEVSIGEANSLHIFENLDGDIAGENNESLHNLKYGTEPNEVSFTSRKNGLYIYNENQNKKEKVAECLASYGKNTYEWKDSDTLYVILHDEGMQDSLYLWNGATQTKKQIEQSVVGFILNSDKSKLYGISQSGKYNGITIELYYKIIEIDIETGERRELTDLDTENFVMEIIDDRYLVYVEEHYTIKTRKVYCMDIETGKKKCIYKTDSRVVGIIWTGEEL